MNPMDANCLVTDCGSMVGHQQRELELVRECVAFFGIDPNDVTTERHFDMRVSSGQSPGADYRSRGIFTNHFLRRPTMKEIEMLIDRKVLIDALQCSNHNRIIMQQNFAEKDGKFERETVDVDGMGVTGGRIKLTLRRETVTKSATDETV